jgi:dephospho-CoA kinase
VSTSAKSIIIGLTGGPGSGKSLAAEFMSDKGAVVLSGDEAGRRAFEMPIVKNRLVRAFGKTILEPNGGLNRRKIGRLVFDNARDLRTLNQIVHPPLLRALKSDVRKCKRAGKRLIVIDAALIFEWGIASWCDFVLTITAKREVRVGRLTASGLSRKEAIDRIISQMPDKDKAAMSDFVIVNDNSRLHLRRQVDEILSELLASARSHH